MNELIIVRGHPGSGKSTFAQQICDILGAKHIENDQFFTNDGIYSFDITKHQKAKDSCLERTKKALMEGHTVVVSNTFTKLNEIEEYLNFAKNNNIKTTFFEMDFHFPNKHDVPDEIVEHKKKDFEPQNNAFKVNANNINSILAIYTKLEITSYLKENPVKPQITPKNIF